MLYKIHMYVLAAQDAFFLARRTRKDSPHTTAAYQRDLAGVNTLLAETLLSPVEDLTIAHLTGANLRQAFGTFADTHAKSSVLRAWSTWNQFLTFCVAEDLIAGNPMGAVARPKTPQLVPKPLRGEDTPEQLLTAAAEGASKGRDPWPERDVLVIALGLVAGLRSAEMRTLTLASIVGREGDKRLHVKGKGNRDRSVPIEPPMERIVDACLQSCKQRFPQGRFDRDSALLRDRHG